MDCKEFERLIPDFIDDKLDYATLKDFCSHMDTCSDCREELVIQFLVTEGIQRLEDGSAFDLQKELDVRMSAAEKKLRIHTGFMRFGLVLEIAAVCLLAGIVVWIIL